MPKQIAFSKSLPLPSMVRREVALGMLHSHGEMIDLNPQVIAHRQIETPRDVGTHESNDYQWHELSEDTSYLSDGLFRSIATYKACYRNLENGVDFHIYGPQGLDVKEQWTITDSPEPQSHLKDDVVEPGRGLWLRRDCNVRSLSDMSPICEKNLYRAHQTFEERVTDKCVPQRHPSRPKFPFARTSSLRFSRISSRSSVISESDESAYKRSSIGSLLDPSDTHPAFRNDIDWSLVSDEDHSKSSTRPTSVASRSSIHRHNSLRRRPNIYTGNDKNSDGSSSRYSYDGSSPSSVYSERCESSSTYYSMTTSLPSSPILEESEEGNEPKPQPEAYTEMVGNPFTAESRKSISSSSASSTPSLVEESSDEEVATPSEEIQTPVDSAEAAKIFEEMQKRYYASLPPPIPERAAGHTVPAPLSVRPQSTLSFHEGGTAYPPDILPLRTSSMKRGSSRNRPRAYMKRANSDDSITTVDAEKMLSLSYGNGFSIYG